jgi:hypothetical protein
MDQREEQFIVGIASGLDPLTSWAALPDEPTTAPPSTTRRGWWWVVIGFIAGIGAWLVLQLGG